MGFRVNNNIPALSASRFMQVNQQELQERIARLASAKRINRAADDAANLAVAERIRTQTNGLTQAARNVQDGISLVQTAEGGLQVIQENTQRIRELSVQAANGTLTDQDRQLIQTEIDQLIDEIDRQAGAVQFNGQPLLTGNFGQANGGLTIQAGANRNETVTLNLETTNATILGIADLDVTTQANAQNAIADLDSAIEDIASQRADIGAFQNRLEGAFNFLNIANENQRAGLSRIEDADIATEIVGLSVNQILQQTGVASLAQANLSSQNVLNLLR
ncbi:MAG: flagellin [Candidatus Hydrogenedentota bacterium]